MMILRFGILPETYYDCKVEFVHCTSVVIVVPKAKQSLSD